MRGLLRWSIGVDVKSGRYATALDDFRSVTPSGLLQSQPPVEEYGLPGHVVRRSRREVKRQEADFPEPSGSPQRHDLLRALRRLPHALFAGGHDVRKIARSNGIDMHAVGRPFERLRPRKPGERSLGGRVED